MGMLFTVFLQTHPASSENCFIFYIISLLSCLKHTRHVLSLAVENNDDADGKEHVNKDDSTQKEVGSAAQWHRR